jgi:menaquinol-cytochrome c reductase iron-sulfur subunit
MCDDSKISRRKVMKWVVLGISAATGGALGVPALLSTLSPTIKQDPKERWRALGQINSFPPEKIVSAKVETRLEKDFMHLALPKDVYVWRRSDGDIIVYSRRCTDLGCPVKFDAGSECFFCPCHGGIFSKEGAVMAGPPKGPLYRYNTRIIDGFLEIDLSSVPVVA